MGREAMVDIEDSMLTGVLEVWSALTFIISTYAESAITDMFWKLCQSPFLQTSQFRPGGSVEPINPTDVFLGTDSRNFYLTLKIG